jgi:hypothetical protein
VKAALHFLPKTPVRGWPGAVADECGFVISPKMAIEYRDCKLQLRNLDSSGSNVLSTAKKAAKLLARIKMIQQRLDCPCPSRYGDKQWQNDRERVRALAHKRESKIALTEAEDADEALRTARSDSLLVGPEEAARKRLQDQDLQQKKRLKKSVGRRMTRKEQIELRLLGLLYSSSASAFSSDMGDQFYCGHPFSDDPFAEDGNLYPPDTRLRPTPSSPEDEESVECISCPPFVTGNPNDPDCPEMRAWLASQKAD